MTPFTHLNYAIRSNLKTFTLKRFNVFIGEEESYKSAAIEAVRLALTGKTHLGATSQAFGNLVPRGKQNASAELLGPDGSAYWSLELGKKGKEPVLSGVLEGVDRTGILSTGLTDDLYSRPDMLRTQYLERFGQDADVYLTPETYWPAAVRAGWVEHFGDTAGLRDFLHRLTLLSKKAIDAAKSLSDVRKTIALRPTAEEVAAARGRFELEALTAIANDDVWLHDKSLNGRLLDRVSALLDEPVIETSRIRNALEAERLAHAEERKVLTAKHAELRDRLNIMPDNGVSAFAESHYEAEDLMLARCEGVNAVLEPLYEVARERLVAVFAKTAERLSMEVSKRLSGGRRAALDPKTVRWSISNGRSGEMFPLEASCRTARTVFRIAHDAVWTLGNQLRILTLDDDDLVGLSVKGMADLIATIAASDFDQVFMVHNRFDVDFPQDWNTVIMHA